MSKIKVIICAGGQGTRLWPISRKNSPKQFKPFLDEQTLLQKTFSRLNKFIPDENIYLCTPVDLKDEMVRQISLDAGHLILEPLRKETGPALALAALRVYLQDPQAIITNVWADHYIGDENMYRQIFETAETFLNDNPKQVFLAGVKPSYAETGYGYIKIGESAQRIGVNEIFQVDSFKEKPNLATAEEYLSSGEYLWNPAMFFFRADHLLSLFEKHAPEIYQPLVAIKSAIGTADEEKIIAEEFAKMPKISIDYAILEKEKDMVVMPADLGWTDVGHWKSIYDMLTGGKEGHAVKGAKYVEIDSQNNLIFSETSQLISTIGIKNCLVIASKDAILICDKERSQDVKKLVEKLKNDPELQALS